MAFKRMRNSKTAYVAGCFLFAAGALIFSNNEIDSVEGGLRERRRMDAVATKPEAPEHKIGADDSGVIWIVNQPKSGTRSIESSIWGALGCEPPPSGESLPSVGHEMRHMECPGNKMLFRTHTKKVNEVKGNVDKVLKGARKKFDQCVVITAVRDPLLSIPSVFFEMNKDEYCDGSHGKEEVIESYADFLKTSEAPGKQAETTAEILRVFGVETDGILEAMNLLSETGYAFFDQPNSEGPWAGCELLLLQLDYDESNSNLDAALGHAIEGVTMKQKGGRKQLCPKAAETYEALVNHKIDDEHIKRYCDEHPEMHGVMTYYKNHRATASS